MQPAHLYDGMCCFHEWSLVASDASEAFMDCFRGDIPNIDDAILSRIGNVIAQIAQALSSLCQKFTGVRIVCQVIFFSNE